MPTSALLLISQENTLPHHWQAQFPNLKLSHCKPDTILSPLPPIVVLDGTTIALSDLQKLIPQLDRNSKIFALVLEIQLGDYAASLLRENIEILLVPLEEQGIQKIKQALETSSPLPEENAVKSLTQASRDFAQAAEDPLKLMNAMAEALRETMNADWVAFLRIELENHHAESLAFSTGFPEAEQHTADELIRDDGFSQHIIKTRMPVLIPDMENFRLDDINVNPKLRDLGFKAALGFPLLREREAFGVMWVLYRETQVFKHQDIRHLQVYAAHAALAYSYPLQKKLAEQWQIAAQKIFSRNHAETYERSLQDITDGIHDALDCDIVTLYPINRWGYLDLPYQKGAKDPEGIRIGEEVLRHSIVYRMLEEKEVVIIEDANQYEAIRKTAFAQREGVASVVILPLHRGDRKVGVVFINYRQLRHFSQDERLAIQLMSDQIAATMLNVYLDNQHRTADELSHKLLEQVEDSRQQLSTLHNFIAAELNLKKQDPNELLNYIARQTYLIAKADRVTIRLIEDEQVSALAIYPDDDPKLRNEEMKIRKKGHSYYIVTKHKPVIISDINNYNPADYENIPLNPKWDKHWKARIGFPLTSGERAIGVMWISYREAHQFEYSQLKLLQTLANMAYVTHKWDTEQEWLTRTLSSLKEAYEHITVGQSEDEILHLTMDLAQRIVSRNEQGLYRSHIAKIEAKRLVFHAAHNQAEVFALLKEKLPPNASISIASESRTIAVQVARTGQAVMMASAKENENFLPLLDSDKDGSQISVPIRVGKRLYAVLSVEHPQNHVFEWFDKAALEAMAGYVGQVLRNREQQELRAAYIEASRLITVKQDISAVLNIIAEAAHNALKFKHGEDYDAYIGLREADSLQFLASYPPETLSRIQAAGYSRVNLNAEPLGVSAYALLYGEVQNIADTRETNFAFPSKEGEKAVISLLAVPIPHLTDNQAIGVISLGHSEASAFDEDDAAFVNWLAQLATIAISRVRDSEAQKAQSDSLLELTHTAMYPFIKGHDFSNFRASYNKTIKQVLKDAEVLETYQTLILKSIGDSKIYQEVKNALVELHKRLNRMSQIYEDLIEQLPEPPQLREKTALAIRTWLWENFINDEQVHLQLDDESLTENLICEIPEYWLREVMKILKDNAKRAIENHGLVIEEHPIRMEARFLVEPAMLEIRMSNKGTAIPPAYRQHLIKRVIPPELRESPNSGKGIGLFMSNTILEAYGGGLSYESHEDETTFILRTPAYKA